MSGRSINKTPNISLSESDRSSVVALSHRSLAFGADPLRRAANVGSNPLLHMSHRTTSTSFQQLGAVSWEVRRAARFRSCRFGHGAAAVRHGPARWNSGQPVALRHDATRFSGDGARAAGHKASQRSTARLLTRRRFLTSSSADLSATTALLFRPYCGREGMPLHNDARRRNSRTSCKRLRVSCYGA